MNEFKRILKGDVNMTHKKHKKRVNYKVNSQYYDITVFSTTL